MTSRRCGAAAAAVLMLLPWAAEAHVGVGPVDGFHAGFTHPFTGLDHLLAMTAVGIWAAQIGGRALWLVPSSFVAMMLAGGALGAAGMPLPMVESVIAGSVLALGALIALRVRPSLAVSAAAVGLFALFHGHAHGTEAPLGVAAADYGAGFALATAMLHGGGIVLALALRRLARRSSRWDWSCRLAGGAIAAAGVALLAAA
ncbi:MAG: HupE/UreJ family protein [Rhodospirillaceae bacterium]|nr:HupE/UreJ family protein [Rhodospirillaceae bacterium]